MTSERLRENFQGVQGRIAEALRRAGRPADSATLVAVTKRVAPERVRSLLDLGVQDLGENYPQELWEKAGALVDREVRWHLIGHLQGNKAKRTLPLVRMVHAVDSAKLLRTLDDLTSATAEPVSACLQVNCSGEPAKHGWTPEAILDDADALAETRSIAVVGLMTIAGYDTDSQSARPAFARLREVRDALRARTGRDLPHLSMGMSGDFEAAIAEGATIVRVGSALFEGLDP